MNNSLKNKVSQTASYTCFCRACADAEQDKRFQGPDFLARKFIPFLPDIILKWRPLRTQVVKKVMPRGVYEYVSARTKLFDEVYCQAVDEVFPQIVILGAGLDTRAWRFSPRNRGTRVFELDTPFTQQMKRKILEQRDVSFPKELTFIPIDFEEEDIGEALSKAGYRAKVRSLFLWEGVTMYLTEKSVVGTLEFIRENAAAGSRVVFDYLIASVIRKENTLYGEASIHNTIFKTGEDWKFGIEEGAIGFFLAERGFQLIAHYRPDDLQKQYLTADDGTVFGRINETHCVAVAGLPE